jgi:hypothetical protein
MLPEEVNHILEELDVSALVAAYPDGLRVFLNSRFNDFRDSSIMAEVNYLSACPLKDPSHDVDGRVVTVEKGSCRDNPYVICRLVWLQSRIHNDLLPYGECFT